MSDANPSNSPAWVVVTRPAPDHLELIEGVEALGLHSLHVPVHVLQPCAEQHPDPALLDTCDIALVTSPATARFLLEACPAEALRHLILIAPGVGTAAALRAAGLKVSCPSGEGTSEAVLALPELASVRGRRVAILGAPGGRTTIASELERRGARVERLFLYRREPVAPPRQFHEALEKGFSLAVLVSSVQIVECLNHAVGPELQPAWRDTLFVVSSARVEQCCRAHGLDHVVRAGSASAQDLLAGLKQALSQCPGGDGLPRGG